MIQEAIVGLIVTLAATSIVLRYTPRNLRQALRTRMIRMAHRHGWIWLERKLVIRALTDGAHGENCSACNACAPMASQDGVVSRITPDQLRGTIRR